MQVPIGLTSFLALFLVKYCIVFRKTSDGRIIIGTGLSIGR